jgi:hypothetical protein
MAAGSKWFSPEHAERNPARWCMTDQETDVGDFGNAGEAIGCGERPGSASPAGSVHFWVRALAWNRMRIADPLRLSRQGSGSAAGESAWPGVVDRRTTVKGLRGSRSPARGRRRCSTEGSGSCFVTRTRATWPPARANRCCPELGLHRHFTADEQFPKLEPALLIQNSGQVRRVS